VANNTIKNYQTSQGRHPCSTDLSLNDDDTGKHWLKHILRESATPENLLVSEETKDLLLRTIKAMPVELRLSLLLRDIEGCSYRKIADIMHCPIGTVRSRIFRARAVISTTLHDDAVAKH
jgi:RNA polymerase sigma-70 factor (ECF subfamily)